MSPAATERTQFAGNAYAGRLAWLAIDPGTTESAFANMLDGSLRSSGTIPNEQMRDLLASSAFDHLAIEMVACYGMAVGAETFETVLWIGRFIEAFSGAVGGQYTKVYRKDVKLHLCGSTKAKDANIRQRLIDLYGGESVAIGGVKCPACKGKGWAGRGRLVCGACDGEKWKHRPGPLRGVAGDAWSALAVARTWWETLRVLELAQQERPIE
jgi:hypothetical protein